MLGLYISSVQAFNAGANLVSQETAVRGMVEQMESYKQTFMFDTALLLHELLLLLLGRNDPVVVNGILMNDDDYFDSPSFAHTFSLVNDHCFL
jgi:hypothetical protein